MTSKAIAKNSNVADQLLASIGELDEDSPLRDRKMSRVATDEVSDEEGKPRFVVQTNEFTKKLGNKFVQVMDEKTVPMVIHWFNPAVQRVFYEDAYDPDNPAGPVCGSNDGVTPDEGVASPQSAKCATCPQNEKGSGARGGRACKFKQRILVSEKLDSGEPVLMEMDVNASSLFGSAHADDPEKMNFKNYLDRLARAKANSHQVITNFTIDRSGANNNCKVVYKPADNPIISDPDDVNLKAHEEWKKTLDFNELVRMDFTPYESSESDQDEPDAKGSKPAEAEKAVAAKEPSDEVKSNKEDNDQLAAASSSLEDWLKG